MSNMDSNPFLKFKLVGNPPTIITHNKPESSTSSISEDSARKIIKTKRHKPIKSCTFCRRRKLKCDKMKPRCSSCKSRGLNECFYMDTANQPNDTSIAKKSSHITPLPLNILNDISKSSPTDKVSSILPSGLGDNIPNPFRSYYYIQSKNGRVITYGPTCLRTFIMRNNWGFKEKYIQLWGKIKHERNICKKRNLSYLQNELDLMEIKIKDSVSILSDIIPCLPDYDAIKEHIETFFAPENSNLHEVNTFLNKKKVLHDLDLAFIHDRYGRIIHLKPADKKNYYKIAVILMILVFTTYRQNVPYQLQKLFIFLVGLTSPKTIYIEKAQFLLQRCFYESIITPNGEEMMMLNLVHNLTNVALSLGLQLNIREIYKDEETFVGNIEKIENLWTWILFFDFQTSIKNGRPLSIDIATSHAINYREDKSMEEFGKLISTKNTSYMPVILRGSFLIPQNLDTVIGNNSPAELNNKKSDGEGKTKHYRDFETDKSFFGKMRRFLYIVRPMIGEYYKTKGIPRLLENGQTLLDFLEEEMKPIKYFTDPNLISELSFGDIRLIFSILICVKTFLSTGFVVLDERSILHKNISIQAHLITFTIFKNFVNYCNQLDEKYFPEMVHPSCNSVPPYLAVCLEISLYPVSQSLGLFYAFFFLTATLFEKGIFGYDDMIEGDWDVSTFKVPSDKSISLITTFKVYKKIFDDWISFDSTDIKGFALKKLLLRSYAGLILISSEKTYRIIVGKALEYRKKIEESLLSSQNSSNNNIVTSLTSNMDQDFSSKNINVPNNEVSPNTVAVAGHHLADKQKYQSYVQYQLQLEQQNRINELQKRIDSLTSNENKSKEQEKLTDNGISGTDDMLGPTAVKTEASILSSSGEMLNVNQVEMAQKLANDFWESYNTGWEELLNNPDIILQEFD